MKALVTALSMVGTTMLLFTYSLAICILGVFFMWYSVILRLYRWLVGLFHKS